MRKFLEGMEILDKSVNMLGGGGMFVSVGEWF